MKLIHSLIISVISVLLFPLEIFAQTRILSFTSSIVFTNTPLNPIADPSSGWTTYRPTGVFASVGSNRFAAIGFNYWTNRQVSQTNREWNGVAYSNKIVTFPTIVPMGSLFIFKYTSSNTLNPTPVLTLTNPNHHTYEVTGSFLTTNSLALSFSTPGQRSFTDTNFTIRPSTITFTDFWLKTEDVLITTTNNGLTWRTNLFLGTINTNYIIATGTGIPDLANDLWVDFKRGPSNRVVI
jgi:hypothetical protein